MYWNYILFPGNKKKILNELRFSIGEQFDLNEFNLKSLKSVYHKGLEYEVYHYIKNDFKSLFGLKVINIELYYNADILSKVIYEFEKESYEKAQIIINNIHIENLILKLKKTNAVKLFYYKN